MTITPYIGIGVVILIGSIIGMCLDVTKIATQPAAFWFIGCLTGGIAMIVGIYLTP